MAWIVRLVSIEAEGEEHSTDVMRIAKPDRGHGHIGLKTRVRPGASGPGRSGTARKG